MGAYDQKKDDSQMRATPIPKSVPSVIEEKRFGPNAVGRFLGQHIVDTTSSFASTLPLFVFMENVVLGMPDAVSMKARGTVLLLNYAFMGSVYSRGRDLSRRVFKVTQESLARTQAIHDTGYLMGFCAAMSPALYWFSGASTKENIGATILALATAPFIGPISGYSIDAFRDLTGIEPSSRLPEKVRTLSSRTKALVAAGIIAVSLCLSGSIYYLTPDKETLGSGVVAVQR